ncbi:MAG: hypothetical protein L7T80_11000, partial [Arenicellales bacterium]|nr:hypothetical protein [Arenicellales bacterium]
PEGLLRMRSPGQDNLEGSRSLLLQNLLRHSDLLAGLLQGRTVRDRSLRCALQGRSRLQVVLWL